MASDKKTRNPMEDVAAEQVISGDNFSAEVDTDLICLTSFGDNSTGPPALSCSRDDVLVDNGAVAPKPCLSPAEMRTRTAPDGSLPAGTASTAMMIIFPSRFLLEPSVKRLRKELAGQTITSLRYWRKVRGRSCKQNRGKLWYLILTVVSDVHAADCFWECGTRCVLDGSFRRCNGGNRG